MEGQERAKGCGGGGVGRWRVGMESSPLKIVAGDRKIMLVSMWVPICICVCACDVECGGCSKSLSVW